MKKLLFVLFLTFASSTLFAQVKANGGPGHKPCAQSDTYGYYIDEIPDAVSYEWSSIGGSLIEYASDTSIDAAFFSPGWHIIRCTVTLSDNTVVVYDLDVEVIDCGWN
jgi:hypothetical protein